MRFEHQAIVLGLVLSSAVGVRAADRYVAQNGQTPASPYAGWATAASNIQDAVNAASANDTVWVADGTYAPPLLNAQVVSITKGLALRGSSGNPAGVTIDGNGTNRGVYVNLTSPACVLIEGFTITNCQFVGAGAGVYLKHDGITAGTAVVQNCVITGNRAGINPERGYQLYGLNPLSGC
ncbi:MAG: hypothetical protein WCS01_16305 [bacterium]